MNSAIERFENPDRLKELAPQKTLKAIGLTQGDTFLDYGAGTGIFTEAAADITGETVYAYDIDPQMIEIIRSKVEEKKLSRVLLLDAPEKLNSGADHSIDHLLMATVFHHISDMDALFSQFDLLMKITGTITIIEFHYRETPLGPPLSHRISRESVEKEFTKRDYSISGGNELGDNFYFMSFQKIH